jgi:hypothetical protein
MHGPGEIHHDLGDLGPIPEFRSHYDAASDLGKVKLILWQIPDGEFPGTPSPGTAPESARITSTRAVLWYLRTATESPSPRLRPGTTDHAAETHSTKMTKNFNTTYMIRRKTDAA